MRRIQRDLAHEEFVKDLTAGERPLFKEIWRLLVFAAAIGVYHKRRVPLDSVDSGKAMPEAYFSTPGWRGFLYLIGIVETGSSERLRSDANEQDALITAFEEYANAGLLMMRERVSGAQKALEEIVAMLAELGLKEQKLPDVDGLI